MDYRAEDQPALSHSYQAGTPACRVLIAVPFYKNEQLVAPLVNGLIACAADLAEIGAELVFYNDSPGYAPLAAALDAMLPAARAAFPCRLDSNPQNLGFVRTMNQAVAEAVARRADLLLLNSDTVVEPGAFPEMLRVAGLDHMIGFVNPRSNNATIATLPLRAHPPAGHEAALAAYQALARRLPPMSYVPTAVGFCLLIRWVVLAEFGRFDEIYGQGYNEENDLVMRASRCGYRAVLANHAFVWHEGEQSFASSDVTRDVWEPANRAILDARYPEYGSYTAAFYNAPETYAERLLATLVPDEQGRTDIAFDFSSFRAAHNGTFQAGRQLLQVAAMVWGPHVNISVICGRDVWDFHEYDSLGVTRENPHSGRCFAAIFRVGQPYDWNVLERLVVCTPVIGVFMLDTISIDCPQLTSPLLYNIWQFTLDHADLIAAQSGQTEHQLRARFVLPDGALTAMSHHSLCVDDYRLAGMDAPPVRPAGAPPCLLVLGNHFHHKFLTQTANALATAFPDRQIVALGAPKPSPSRVADPMAVPPLALAVNLSGVPVGDLTDADIGALYAAADAVVFPSHAEGFGFPALNALAARRPVFLRRLPVFEELWQALNRTPNMHFYDTTSDLIRLLQALPAWIEETPPNQDNGTERACRELKTALDRATQQASYHRIVRRIRAIQLISDIARSGAQQPIPDTAPEQAARFLGTGVEAVTRRLLRHPLIYKTTRTLFRATRRLWRLLRGAE